MTAYLGRKKIEAEDCTPDQIRAVRKYCDHKFPGPEGSCLFGRTGTRSCNWIMCGPEIEAGLATLEAAKEKL